VRAKRAERHGEQAHEGGEARGMRLIHLPILVNQTNEEN
jgi:hypothetical protein